MHRAAMLVVFAGAGAAYLTHWGIWGRHLAGPPVWFYALAASVGGFVFFLAPMLFGNAAIIGGVPRDEDTRPFVLYLRPFEVDLGVGAQLLLGASAGLFVWLGTLHMIFMAIGVLPLFLNITVEQKLHDALVPFGRLIAFGRPGTRLDPVGAWRRRLGEQWQSEILPYLSDATLVVVRPGLSPSIVWELGQVLDRVPPSRLLFVLPSGGGRKKRRRAWHVFRTRMKLSRLAVELPENPGTARYLVVGADGTPRLLGQRNLPGDVLRFLVRGELPDRLKPVLQNLGITLPPPPSDLASRLSRLHLRFCVYLFDAALLLLVATVSLRLVRIF